MLKDAIAKYKHPSEFVFVKEIPKNPMGKIVVSLARALAEQELSKTVEALN